MIIDKIEIENFMCYAGKNCFKFTKGINVIIGDNGYGKSKLYDAFYWVLYDKIFVSENKEFQPTKYIKSKLISDKTKYETKNGHIYAKVAITFHNQEKDIIYIVERKYSIHVDDGKIDEAKNSELSIIKKDFSFLSGKLIEDENSKQNILNILMPPQKKDYLWFQGEQVESIIDFNQQDTLTKAINVLSNISKYDKINDIALSVSKTAKTEFEKEVRKKSKDATLSDELNTQREQYEFKVRTLVADEKELKNNLAIAEQKCKELLNHIEDAQSVSKLQQSKKHITDQLYEKNDVLKLEQVNFHRKIFKNKWIIKGTEFIIDEYSLKYSTYEKKRLDLLAKFKANEEIEDIVKQQLQTRLPINVPEPIYVQNMLDKEKCLVCDREAKKDSDAWNKIKQLLPNSIVQKNEIKSFTKHDFSDDLKKLYHNGLTLKSRIDEIDDDINDSLTNIYDLSQAVKSLSYKINEIDLEIQSVLSSTSLNVDAAENVVNEYTIQLERQKDYSEKLNRVTYLLTSRQKELKTINDKMSSLATDEVSIRLKEKNEVASDFAKIAKSTRERIFNELIIQLEKEANSHYKIMTAGNKSARGNIRLKEQHNGNYMPEVVDDAGHALIGSNTSNIILVKLATIMAIISARNNGGGGKIDSYTLITDAPTSVFGEDYTIGFCKAVSSVYQQSIIMSKEFYKNQNLRNNLLNSNEINTGKVYEINPSISEKDRANRHKLSTIITEIN